MTFEGNLNIIKVECVVKMKLKADVGKVEEDKWHMAHFKLVLLLNLH